MSATLGRSVAMVALVVGPLSLIVGNVVQWTLQPAAADATATDVAAQFPAAWLIVGLLGVFGPIVWLAAVPAAVGLAPARGAVVTRIGGLITGVGIAAGIGHVALFFGVYGALAQAGLPSGAATAVEAAADQDALGNILLVVFLIGFCVGPVILTVGLRVARVVGVWVPIAAVVAGGTNLFGGPIAGVVQLLAVAAVWGSLLWAVASRHAATRRGDAFHRNSDVGAPA